MVILQIRKLFSLKYCIHDTRHTDPHFFPKFLSERFPRYFFLHYIHKGLDRFSRLHHNDVSHDLPRHDIFSSDTGPAQWLTAPFYFQNISPGRSLQVFVFPFFARTFQSRYCWHFCIPDVYSCSPRNARQCSGLPHTARSHCQSRQNNVPMIHDPAAIINAVLLCPSQCTNIVNNNIFNPGTVPWSIIIF